jgi:hypothetical protein
LVEINGLGIFLNKNKRAKQFILSITMKWKWGEFSVHGQGNILLIKSKLDIRVQFNTIDSFREVVAMKRNCANAL